MDYKKIIASIRKKEYAPAYLLHGDEDFYIDKLVDIFEKEILTETEKAFNYAVMYGKDSDFKQVIEQSRQFPVMSEKRLIILKEAKSMRSLTKLSAYFKSVNPATILVIVHKHAKLDGRTQLMTEIKKKGVVFLSESLRDYQVAAWVKNYVKELGYKINEESAQLLGELTGTSLSQLSNELGKVIINLPKSAEITKEIIFEQVGVNKDYNAFELQKALSERNISKAHRIILYFAANTKSHPFVLLIGTLFRYYSKLYIAKSLSPTMPDRDFAMAIGIGSAFFAKEYKMAIRHYSMEEIKECIQTLHHFDMRSKGVDNNNFSEGELMKELVERLLFVKHLVTT